MTVNPKTIRTLPAAGSPSYTGTGTNAAVVLTLPAQGAGIANGVRGVCWSYSTAPTGGSLTITDKGNTVFQLGITAAGPSYLDLKELTNAAGNCALVFTLAAGGNAVVGDLTLLGVFTTPATDAGVPQMDFQVIANDGYAAVL